ncbi:hypothetical protein CCAX7_28900 [Capsulimonas corticalis]|uniref:Uncharacterized protein n=2 Tax=Capsulimonas corticalis TaxID=2219043 RepID=A0A402CT81_9BACT|nr:hypothetical protein CCAX7_28900 [Capsulimonas corticalis]
MQAIFEHSDEATMTTAQIALAVADLARQGKFGDEIARFYADDIVSVEPEGVPAEARGRAAVAAKVQAWFDDYDVHQVTATGPFVHGDEFIIGLKIQMTPRNGGETILFEEAARYVVRDGKIVEERFYC